MSNLLQEFLVKVQCDNVEDFVRKLKLEKNDLETLRQLASLFSKAFVKKLREEEKNHSQGVELQRKKIKNEKDYWNCLEKKFLETNLDRKKDVTTFDVGGKIFMISTTQLTMEDHYFSKMLSGDWKEKEGPILIDANPTAFGYILMHLRGDSIPFPLLSTKEMFYLNEDANYYQIPSLITKLKEEQTRKERLAFEWHSNLINLSNYNVTAERNSEPLENGLYSEYVLGNHSFIDCPEQTVQIVSGSDLMIGIATRAIVDTTPPLHNSCGWYISQLNCRGYSQNGEQIGHSLFHSRKIKPGSFITVSLKDNTLKFKLKEKGLITSFSIPSSGKYYLAILMNEAGSKVSF